MEIDAQLSHRGLILLRFQCMSVTAGTFGHATADSLQYGLTHPLLTYCTAQRGMTHSAIPRTKAPITIDMLMQTKQRQPMDHDSLPRP